MRTTKELLILLRHHCRPFMTQGCPGLCIIVAFACSQDLITEDESVSLKNYINTHRPKPFSRHYSYKQRRYSYYWEPGKVSPREKWLDAQIKKL